MIRELHARDLTDLWDKVNHEFVVNPDIEDFSRPGVSKHSFHNVLTADSCDIDHDKIHLQSLGYTRVKWTMLMKLYFDPHEYSLMINRLRHYKEREQRGKKYVPDLGMQFRSRENRSGSCLLGITFRFSLKTGWECSVFSRTNETTARWAIDLIFLNRLIDTVGEELGYFTAKDVKLYWSAGSLFQSCTTAPLYMVMMNREKELKRMAKDYLTHLQDHKPTQFNSDFDHWYLTLGRRYGESYNGKYSEHGKLKYQTYKSQVRVTDAYLAAKGEKEGRPYVPNSSLKFPSVDLNIQDDFFTKKGFR